MMASAEADLEELGVEVPDSYSKLASIGARGSYHGNMHRDLVKLINCKIPTGLEVGMPFRAKHAGTWQEIGQEILLPHELFAHMWKFQRKAFDSFIRGPPGSITGFWDAMANSPLLHFHPIRHEPDFQDVAIPIALHGDGVPVTGVGKSWSKSCDVYSWCSLLGGGRIALSGFPRATP